MILHAPVQTKSVIWSSREVAMGLDAGRTGLLPIQPEDASWTGPSWPETFAAAGNGMKTRKVRWAAVFITRSSPGNNPWYYTRKFDSDRE
jgi:hypothetical protein